MRCRPFGIILIIEGVLLIIFARQNHIGSAIPCLVAWSFFVQAAEGATFGIVPYVCPEGLGGVCAVGIRNWCAAITRTAMAGIGNTKAGLAA